jgi:hypothetical protein
VSRRRQLDASDWIALGSVVVALLALWVGYLGWRKADEANRIAASANTYASAANELAREANNIAQEANQVVTNDITYRHQQDIDSRLAVLHIPSHNPLTWYTSKGPFAVIAVDMVNKGAGDIRDLDMSVLDNGVPLQVERGKIARLSRDDEQDPSRLQFLISYDTEWAASPESHLIRVHFKFEDGTGPREEDRCFRFSEAGTPGWISRIVPYD